MELPAYFTKVLMNNFHKDSRDEDSIEINSFREVMSRISLLRAEESANFWMG